MNSTGGTVDRSAERFAIRMMRPMVQHLPFIEIQDVERERREADEDI